MTDNTMDGLQVNARVVALGEDDKGSLFVLRKGHCWSDNMNIKTNVSIEMDKHMSLSLSICDIV